jgi:hypothetical protein
MLIGFFRFGWTYCQMSRSHALRNQIPHCLPSGVVSFLARSSWSFQSQSSLGSGRPAFSMATQALIERLDRVAVGEPVGRVEVGPLGRGERRDEHAEHGDQA